MHSIKLSKYIMGIKLDKGPLTVEQNNYASKLVHVYVVCDLDAWPKNPNNIFKFKKSLFGATSVVKDINKGKHVSSGYGITFDSEG